MFASLQQFLLALITVVLLAVEVYSLVDALRRPAAAFVSAGKRTKNFWSALLAIAAVLGFIGLTPPLGGGFLGLAVLFAVIPAMIYLSDVRPALGGRRRPRGGGPSGSRGGW
ncbi:Protein of unknown function [Sanguibacter gelidistatuariae]|uniref:DUF2516 family protein n=1 Tax=Sanguibacter gelidistatuariae TaxID=1814289 RepID=A0A1G6UCY4_9MICO|nr:DUF2516 family protein [Sanguibacter gelidistatuariae]SDD39101.1 Protein of unknown function [Sanguibacter gelidistatuariae]